VPQCYLKAFALGDGTLRAISKENLQEFNPSPKKICAEKDYYLFDLLGAGDELKFSFEQFMSNSIEPLYARIHRERLAEKKDLSETDCKDLAHFALWQFWRSPLARGMSNTTDVSIPNASKETEQRIRHIGTAIKNVFHAFECGNFRIEIHYTGSDDLLPTSDQPSVFCGVDEKTKTLYFINEFESWRQFQRSHHYGMPISPNAYLFLFVNHVEGNRVSFHKSEGDHYQHLVDKIALAAQRFIIDPNPTRSWSQRATARGS
jgi:hypothetical protein